MKGLYIVLMLLLSFPPFLHSQVSVNNDGSAADNSAMFEVDSETKGFLPPRMTLAQMRAISAPAEGLVIFNTDTKALMYFDGTIWKNTNPESCGQQVMDSDGNIYNTVLIGNLCWMDENLKTTSYSNGNPIPNVTDDPTWSVLSTPAYAWYNNNIGWKDDYGALYNWFATVDANGLCPKGWHVASHDDWTELTDYLGGTTSPHGNELKSCRQINSPLGGNCSTFVHPRWAEHITEYGTDDYGFSALPGGYRFYFGPFYTMGGSGYWWTSTEASPASYAHRRFMSYDSGGINSNSIDKRNGYSVRCVLDE